MNWGALAAIGLLCFIIGLTWEAFSFWGALIGRSIGERQMAKLRTAEKMAQLQSGMAHWNERKRGYVMTGICRTCGLKVPGGGHRRECRGLLG